MTPARASRGRSGRRTHRTGHWPSARPWTPRSGRVGSGHGGSSGCVLGGTADDGFTRPSDHLPSRRRPSLIGIALAAVGVERGRRHPPPAHPGRRSPRPGRRRRLGRVDEAHGAWTRSFGPARARPRGDVHARGGPGDGSATFSGVRPPARMSRPVRDPSGQAPVEHLARARRLGVDEDGMLGPVRRCAAGMPVAGRRRP